MSFPLIRLRRNRVSAFIRDMVRETDLNPADFVYPLFLIDGDNRREEISSMPGLYRVSIDLALHEISILLKLGIRGVALFPVISQNLKDPIGSESINPDGLLQRGIRAIKSCYSGVVLITDVALDPYSSDGHDGVVVGSKIDNDASLSILAGMAVSQAEAGADLVAPSDMMDGRIKEVRLALDRRNYSDVGIISYAVKYASSLYGPFRDALSSAPRFGDKKTYQMDPGNIREAVREVLLDIEEGADMVMVKPASLYLDVISKVRDTVNVPIVAYNVSGEYSMIKAAAMQGWIDEERAMLEMLTSIKRAGADLIFSYFAKDIAILMN